MCSLLMLLASIPSASPEVSVPPGFSIKQFADNSLAADIYTMTIDDEGRVLVAGRGYVRVLVDDNGDGIADRAVNILDDLRDGPMGLLAEGDSLYVVSEGGLQRYRGYNGKDKLKQPPEMIVKLKTTGEHDGHMVRRGPDGWLYLLCGNNAGVNKDTIVGHRSPVKEPVAGSLLRISPDGKEIEVVADGFRNPYSFDFNLEGEPFTSDSDNERCVGLPWYEPCRFYHLVPGGNYGWRSPQLGKFWRKPPYFFDCVPPVCYLGRGSPTGVVCYRHTHFPEYYRGGFFLADWTFGRIDFVTLDVTGSTYTGEVEPFAEAIGTSGFAPTGLAVHPLTGELFTSIGGRGTRGGVYRISYDNSPPGKPITLSKRSLDWSAEAGKKWLADCQWNGKWSDAGSFAEQRARRQALELILRHAEKFPWGEPLGPVIKQDLCFPDHLTRMAAARVVKGLFIKVGQVSDPQSRLMLAFIHIDDDPDWSIHIASEILGNRRADPQLRLQAVRLIQLAYGDFTANGTEGTIWEGYTLRNAKRKTLPPETSWMLRMLLRNSDDPALQKEIARTLVLLGGTEYTVMLLTGQISSTSSIESDIHYLALLGQVNEEWSNRDTRIVVNWLLKLEEKVTRDWVTRDQNWPLRVEEILEALGRANPDIAERLLNRYEFGRPEHLLFVKPLGMPRVAAAKKFLAAAENDSNYSWTPGLIRLLDGLSLRVTRPVLLKLWDRPQLRDAILRLLADVPELDDRPRFIQGLGSFDPEIVRLCAGSLAKLSTTFDAIELAESIRALRRAVPEDTATRLSLISLLRKRTGETFSPDPKLWLEWATKKYPGIVKLLDARDGFDLSAWKKREAGIPWEKGDAFRGLSVFTRASCASCHDGGRAMGPSLQGVAKRFSRQDLLTAILEPSKDVSPRYRPTRVTTGDEKVFTGMIVYEATDGILLQTGPDSVIRIAGENIASKRTLEVSLMPAGLLDKLSDLEVADLMAYLKSPDEVKSK
jgi:putative heme-binding domain-containing protein